MKRANNTKFGLASYIFSQDCSQIHRVSRLLQVGIVSDQQVSATEKKHVCSLVSTRAASRVLKARLVVSKVRFKGWLNTKNYRSHPVESGMGREGGRQGLDEFTTWKYITQTF